MGIFGIKYNKSKKPIIDEILDVLKKKKDEQGIRQLEDQNEELSKNIIRKKT